MRGGGRKEWVAGEEVTRDWRIPPGRSSLLSEGWRVGGGGLYMVGMPWLTEEVEVEEEEGGG